MRTDDLLILNYRNFSERVGTVYSKLSSSAAASEMLVNDPVGVFAKLLFSEYNITSGEINQGNRLLFSLLSNRKFMKWSKEFEKTLKNELKEISEEHDDDEKLRLLIAKLDRTKLYREIAGATLEFGDIETIFSLTVKDPDTKVRRPIDIDSQHVFPPGINPLGCELADVAVDVETFVYAVAAVAVFVVAVAAVAVGLVIPSSIKETLTREDLSKITNFMSERLTAKAMQTREAGLLTSMQGVQGGGRL